ncbi:ABC transporter permease [Leucobacter sp. Z1108]|uniref:ABC transporter permease n=1 Tax=Leucobacter sp. Z1108 TaxID=3439066 RepID=UPI003F3615C4
MRNQSQLLRYGIGSLGVAAAVGLWQIAAAVGPLRDSPLPTATAALSRTWQLLFTAEMWRATGETIMMMMIGLIIGVVFGIVLGVAIGISPLAMHATRVPLEFLKPVPPIVILPIVLLVLGPTMQMGIFLVVFGTFITVAVQSAAGVFDTDPVARATGRSYGMGKLEILRSIVIPSALPYIGTAIRISAPIALIISVIAGLLGGGPGLGQSLLLSQVTGDREKLFAYVLILGTLGLLVQALSQWAERRLLHWHPQYRKEDA